MKIVFANNYLNHHERFLSDALYGMSDVEFHFIQTIEVEQERLSMGWEDMTDAPYCICSYKSESDYIKAKTLCLEADALIMGGAPNEFFVERAKYNKLTFFYCERLFRSGVWHMLNPKTFVTVLNRFILPGKKSNFYMLCASGYTALDCHKIFAFRDKYFRWGHFIDVNPCNCKAIDSKQADLRLKHPQDVSILWAGRLIGWKHPEMSIHIAKVLRKKNINFTLNIIGTGEMEQSLHTMIIDNQLERNVHILGAMKPIEVRKYMEASDIYLFTSDFNEGWGAVLGEAMAAGCAVVASHGIGATPFLVKHGVNGLIYETGNYASFEHNVLKLIDSTELRQRLSKKAVDTMLNLWSPEKGAERFYQICESLLGDKEIAPYIDGPMSKADLLNNNWFKDDTI